MSLRRQVDRLEGSERVTVISCAMYRKRHIFFADDDNYYVLTKTGSYQFPTLEVATREIDSEPERFPTS